MPINILLYRWCYYTVYLLGDPETPLFDVRNEIPIIDEVFVDDGFNENTQGWGVTHFDNIADGLKNLRLQAQVTFGKTGLPTLLIINADTGQPIIQYRVKQEFKSDGSPYVRNYVEKQKELGSIIGQQL